MADGSGSPKNAEQLDWMYKGPAGLVDREEYLLGRAVDKTFELIQQSEKGSGASGSNSVEYDCTPSSIFASRGDEQVDIARKLQEDPLLDIKKKEKESIKKILSNPVKMKHLKRMISQNNEQEMEKRRKSKPERNSAAEGSSEKDLDRLLAAKITDLKKKLVGGEEERRHRKEDSRRAYSDRRRDHRKRERSRSPAASSSGTRSSSSSQGLESKWKKPERPKLSAEEMEKRRQEMMGNAKWREEQRKKNVHHLREEERKEEENQRKNLDPVFIRKQLCEAAAMGSVEGRIKANRYNIQRSSAAMDKNFARR